MLHSSLGRDILSYEYIYTGVYGDTLSSHESIKPQLERLHSTELQAIPGIKIESDKAVIAGFFKKDDRHAVLLVNTHNPFNSSVTAKVKVTSGAAIKELSIDSGQGELVILQEV